MSRTIITAVGIDKPGLVNKITSIINQAGGNIENSKMIKIENQFAMIIDFSCSQDLAIIKSELDSIESLKISYKTVKKINLEQKLFETYLIKGADDQGIIDTVSNYFKKNNLNIIEIDTFIEPAPITGSPLFNMKITVEHNQLADLTEITKKLLEICEELNLSLN